MIYQHFEMSASKTNMVFDSLSNGKSRHKDVEQNTCMENLTIINGKTFTTHLNMIIRFNVLVIKTEVENKTASSFDGVNRS